MAIIGRPNVGKSALFNRLIGRRQALVDATPGLTRDRLYGEVRWGEERFRLIDTGGLEFRKGNRMSGAIALQVDRAMREADLALFVFDVKTGLLPLDKEVALWLRRWGKPVIPVVNKVDNEKELSAVYEFAGAGFGEPVPVSSLHGLRVGELMERITRGLSTAGRQLSADQEESKTLTAAIVGRPNVGKSSLINRILDEERVLVDDRPGTTRDPVEVEVSYGGRVFRLIDTAGVQSKSKLKSRIDAVARIKAMEMIRGSDVCIGVLDGSLGLVKDDLKLLDRVVQMGKPLCLAVNKSDLIEGSRDEKQAALYIGRAAPFLRFAPVLFVSAKTGFQVLQLLEKIPELAEAAGRRIRPADGQRLLGRIRTDSKAPVAVRNAHLFRLIQVGAFPPTFHLLGRMSKGFRGSDVAYLERMIRGEFGLQGTPVVIRLLVDSKKR
ncbi:MAG: ribosome biogenesis GTPase Der [Candidatus Omnitrophica bacterium]|nr:ribosome biogenesis GTPase Der [Candidatus Omnitrophota bacterium]